MKHWISRFFTAAVLYSAIFSSHSAPTPVALPDPSILKAVENIRVAPAPGVAESSNRKSLSFRVDGVDYNVSLEPNPLIGQFKKIRWVGLDQPPPGFQIPIAYRGRLNDDPKSWVRFVLRDSGVVEGMLWRNDEAYFFEPATDFDPAAAPNATVMYRLADAPSLWTPAMCGVDEANNTPTNNAMQDLRTVMSELQTQAVSEGGTLRLGTTLDYEYYTIYKSDIAFRLAAIFGPIDGLLNETLGIRLMTSDLLVYTTPDQPLTSTVPFDLLTQFSDLRSDPNNEMFPTGHAHLLTGKKLSDNTAGIAYLEGVCRGSIATALSMNYNAWDSAQVMLVAHEIGHNLGAHHDGGSAVVCETQGPGYLMWPMLLSTNQVAYSSCSVNSMKNILKTSQCIITNFPPTADAGRDRWIWGATTVRLDGTRSTDSDGSFSRVQWTQIEGDNIGFKPFNDWVLDVNVPAIPDSRSSRTFKFRITVEDDDGEQASDDIVVYQYAGANKAPIANAGNDITVTGAQTITLSGSQSYDPDGHPLASYAWTIVSGYDPNTPISLYDIIYPDAKVALSNPSKTLTYTFKVKVTDVGGATAEDTVVVTHQPATANQAPIAKAGPDIAAKTHQLFTLDASASSDPDGTISKYEWDTGQTGKTATHKYTSSGRYIIKLTVTDNLGAKSSDELVVTVTDSTFSKNFPNLYMRGTHNSWGNADMQLIANNTWQGTATFGSGSSERFKFDVYGDWRQNYGDNNNDKVADPSGQDITISGQGTYVITFNDNTRSYSVTKQNNGSSQAPIAKAGADITTPTGSAVNFDGSASSDPDGAIANYAWTSPAFGGATLYGAKSSFVFNAPGVYTVTLTVTDNAGLSNTDTLQVTVTGAPNTSSWKPTAIMIYGETVVGQDMFIRGGIDWDYAKDNLGRNCYADKWQCAIPIKHRLQTTDKSRSADTFLDWYGAESGQGNVEGSPLAWTTNAWPSSWGTKRTVAADGYGETTWNKWGHHYWLLFVDMDCSKAVNGWFELKAYISNGPGWESNITQPGAPYKSANHFAQCGKLNVFKRGQNDAVAVTDIPSGNPTP